MRKAMWKKGLSVAMAAAMLTGTVTVPAVFNTSAIVKAAEVAEKSMPATPKAIDGMVYATVNMEYADFFYGELNNIAAGNETTPDLSNDKVASYRETGMYDAVTSATNKKSIKYHIIKQVSQMMKMKQREAMEQFLIRHYMELKK